MGGAANKEKPEEWEIAPLNIGLWAPDMKTTIKLPDDSLIEAKKRAGELGRPLRALFE